MGDLIRAEGDGAQSDTLLDAVAEGFGRLKVLGITGVPAAAAAPGKASPLKAAVMAWVAALTRAGLYDTDAGRVREAFAEVVLHTQAMPSVYAVLGWLPPRPRPLLTDAVTEADPSLLLEWDMDTVMEALAELHANCGPMPLAEIIKARRALAPAAWRRLFDGQAAT